MQILEHYLPHAHLLLWGILALVIAILMIIYFKSFTAALREMFSEKLHDGTAGKISYRRVGIMMFALSIIYVFIYSMHTDKPIDHLAFGMMVAAVILGWGITSPEALGNLIDKLKGLGRFDSKPEKIDTNE